jgi:hypothetical protein
MVYDAILLSIFIGTICKPDLPAVSFQIRKIKTNGLFRFSRSLNLERELVLCIRDLTIMPFPQSHYSSNGTLNAFVYLGSEADCMSQQSSTGSTCYRRLTPELLDRCSKFRFEAWIKRSRRRFFPSSWFRASSG